MGEGVFRSRLGWGFLEMLEDGGGSGFFSRLGWGSVEMLEDGESTKVYVHVRKGRSCRLQTGMASAHRAWLY